MAGGIPGLRREHPRAAGGPAGHRNRRRFPRELAVLAARTLGEGLSCGITLQPNGRPLTGASSDANAAQVDELQYGPDHGPCLTALRQGEEVRIDDLATD